MTTGGVTIRPGRPDDIAQILEVLRAALGESPVLRRTPELWAWKHLDNPFGQSLVLVAEAEGRLAGVRAFMRWTLLLPDGTPLSCLRPVDTATHPDFERRGIFRQLTTAAVDQAREEDVDLIFNTPNARSGAGYLTMGWQEVGTIGVMIRPLFGPGRADPAGFPEPAEFFSSEAGEPGPPWPSPRAARGLRTPRTPEYLAWRFSGHPYVRYRTVRSSTGVAVLRPNIRNARKEVVLSDVLSLGSRLIGRAASVSRASYLVGWFSPGSPERAAAVRGGMVPIPRVRALTLVANPLKDLPIDVFQPGSWDLALGDLELL